jgi:hypothetical protein
VHSYIKMTRWIAAPIAAMLIRCTSSEKSSCTSRRYEDDAVSLMQIQHSASKRMSLADEMQGNTCSNLYSQGGYFTVPVGIGSPAQTFNLIVDTGSDALIVPDCRCVEAGYCSPLSRCFAPEDSESFALDQKKDQNNKSHVLGASMDYGGGELQALIGSDHVNLAGMQAKLTVFLMEDRRSLHSQGDFEGILGLGLSHKHSLTKAVELPSFMAKASEVKSYTLCFNPGPGKGVLRTSPEPLPNPMGNIGEVHWALGLEGMSVGRRSNPIVLCDPTKKPDGQKTACGAIPDSGTTLMMGPSDHIHALYASLCDEWPRCKKGLSSAAAERTKSKAFYSLLSNCEAWMTEDNGVAEVPSVHIHLSGAQGTKQTVELPAWSYVAQSSQDIHNIVSQNLFDRSEVSQNNGTDGTKKVCTASFGPQDQISPENGPIWILGAPAFYAARVGFSVHGKQGPEISFVEGPCGACSESSLLSTDGLEQGASAKRSLRQLHGPIQRLSVDASRPL